MNYQELIKIKKPLFGCEELAKVFGQSQSSARVTASRYVKKGLLTRLKKNTYVLSGTLQKSSRDEIFSIASHLQVPSYISFQTALEFYELTTQIQQSYVECVLLKRTVSYGAEGFLFNYSRIDKSLYFGFRRENGFFIAEPEKALLDCLYFSSIGRYSFDPESVYFNKFDKKNLKKMALPFPETTKGLLKKWIL